jgi:hypothetical protein
MAVLTRVGENMGSDQYFTENGLCRRNHFLFFQHFNHFPNALIPSLTLISRIKQKLSEQKIRHCFRQYPQGKS